jgi:RNA polymerase sigma factor (sigma-70 family)
VVKAANLERLGTIAVHREDRLAQLYRLHASDGLRLAFVLTGDRHVAEDITQEAFVRLGRKVIAFKDPDHARAYMFRVIINLCRGRGRRLRIERTALARMQARDVDQVPDLAQRDEIWRALLLVPQRQRAALFLRYYLDQSEVQAAEELDCSVSALKSLVSRGLSTLRKSLQGEGDE